MLSYGRERPFINQSPPYTLLQGEGGAKNIIGEIYMTRERRNINAFLQQVRLGIQNAQAVPEIASALAAFGFDAARIQAGATLLATAETLQAVQVKEYSEQFQATNALNEAQDAADKLFGTQRKLAKLALRDDPEAQKALLLHERKKETLDPWLGQAGVFYKNVLGDPDMLAVLAQYNVTEAQLLAGQTAVVAVANLNANQEKEKSEAQKATKARDKALDDLDEWYVEFRELARIALEDDAQQLEALGLGSIP